MKTSKCFKHAFAMVVHSKLRSWLTIIGIVIGVGAVIAIVSIGEGMQQSLNAQLSGLGGNILTISPGFSRGSGFFGGRGGGAGTGTSSSAQTQATEKEIVLSRTDLQALKSLSEIALIDTNIRGTVEIVYLGKSGKVSITGVDQKIWNQITTVTLKEGRMLDSADQNVIVIGGRLAASYFSKPLGINKMVAIGGNAFRVVGILDDQSNTIYMPIQMAYQIIEDKKIDIYDSIVVKIKNEDQLDEVIAKIESKLIQIRHVTEKKKDFSVTSSKQLQQTRLETLKSINAFLVAIAAVSLIVGAVGIANTMFTSVLEKTKEIGIMKAIGARNNDILLIFLFNAGLIGLVGGLIGVLFGAALSYVIPSFLTGIPLGRGGAFSTFVSMNSVIMALSVSFIVGIIAGIIPAYKGSKLKPVDALRYE